MPRAQTIEVNYFPLNAEWKNAAKTALGGMNEVTYDVEQPWEPLLFRLVIPKLTVKKLNALFTVYFEDVTGAAQIIQEAVCEGITAAGNTGPLLIERRIVPEKDLNVNAAVPGPRKLTIQGESSGEEVTIPANTAKCVCFAQVLNLARQ